MAADIGDPAALPAAVDRALRRPDEGAERRRYHRDMLFGGCQDGRAVERIHRNISALAKV
jgi:hypothetical protein